MPDVARLAVAGASGRMGRALLAAAQADARVVSVGGFGRSDGAARSAALDAASVVVDVSTPAAAAALARELAHRAGPALVVGTTGFSPEEEAVLADASQRIPLLRSGNFSLGVNLLLGLVRRAAAALGPEYDVEVAEAHHRRKVDAPSGTALMLGEAAAEGRGAALADLAVRARDGITGPRAPGSIGFSVVRGGGIVGEHSVMFAAEDEVVTLSHSALDRAVFARGAVEAAVWLAAPGRAPGLYGMADVLDLGDPPPPTSSVPPSSRP